MHQWTGQNILEFLSTYDLRDSLRGIEGFIAFLLKSLREYMKTQSNEIDYDQVDGLEHYSDGVGVFDDEIHHILIE